MHEGFKSLIQIFWKMERTNIFVLFVDHLKLRYMLSARRSARNDSVYPEWTNISIRSEIFFALAKRIQFQPGQEKYFHLDQKMFSKQWRIHYQIQAYLPTSEMRLGISSLARRCWLHVPVFLNKKNNGGWSMIIDHWSIKLSISV